MKAQGFDSRKETILLREIDFQAHWYCTRKIFIWSIAHMLWATVYVVIFLNDTFEIESKDYSIAVCVPKPRATETENHGFKTEVL